MELFVDASYFNVSLLEKLQKILNADNARLEDIKKTELDIFNHSNCQCENEAYEFTTERLIEVEFQHSFLELSAELLIVGLYKQCEIYNKKLVTVLCSEKSKHEIDKLCKLNKNLRFYHAINELRLVNNCVKHSGMVSNELATTYSGWVKETALGYLLPTYERLISDVRRYMKEHEIYVRQIAAGS